MKPFLVTTGVRIAMASGIIIRHACQLVQNTNEEFLCN